VADDIQDTHSQTLFLHNHLAMGQEKYYGATPIFLLAQPSISKSLDTARTVVTY